MKSQPTTVYLPDTKDVRISHYGFGNLKLGMGVFTYSRYAGKRIQTTTRASGRAGTCPGATVGCEAICYAKRIDGPLRDLVYRENYFDDVPRIPEECKVLRLHVSGDFDTAGYIENWIKRLTERPDVTCWAYTRSWRVEMLLPALERLRALPNVQLFASMDASTTDEPPKGWRRSWILRSVPHPDGWPMEERLLLYRTVRPQDPVPYSDGVYYESNTVGPMMAKVRADQTPAYICPEETGAKPNCLACGYCFEGKRHDVVFLEH